MPDPHTGFIVAAFVVTLVVIGGMVLAIALDHRRLARDLERLSREVPCGAADDLERP